MSLKSMNLKSIYNFTISAMIRTQPHVYGLERSLSDTYIESKSTHDHDSVGQFVLDAEQRQDSVGHLISIMMI